MGGANLDPCGEVALKVQIQLEAVVHLVVGDVVATAVKAFHLAVVHDAHHLVDQMHAPVKNHTAAVLLVTSPVTGNTTGALDSRLYAEHLAQLSRRIDLLHHQVIAVPTAVLVCRKQPTGAVGGVDHLLQILMVQGHGLFADDVFAGFHCLNGERHMQFVRNGEGENVHRFVRQDGFKRIIYENTVFPCELTAFLFDIPDAGKLGNVAFQQVTGVPAAHSAVSDYNDSFLCSIHFGSFPETPPTGALRL